MTDQARFLQIHTLTPYIGVLLNRDDAGQAKRLPLGGTTRGRVSSQCLKRHWRRATGEWSLEQFGDLAIRSRQTFVKYVAEPLTNDEGLDPEKVTEATLAIQAELLGESKKAAAKKKAEDYVAELKTNQVIVLGHAEVEYVKTLTRALVADAASMKDLKAAVKKLIKDEKPNFASMREGAGLDAALFGRMVTGDILARCDAAVHVAHAFTVNALETEPDYFTAVDDIIQDSGEQGSGHINISELTSGLYYSYVVIDLPLLVSNLQGCDQKDWTNADRSLAGKVVEQLIGLIATVSPGAKLGSTAPYGSADTVVVEAGSHQPRSLANAFYSPVSAGNDLREAASDELRKHLARLDGMYGRAETRQASSLIEGFTIDDHAPVSLPDLAAWAGAVAAGTQSSVPGA